MQQKYSAPNFISFGNKLVLLSQLLSFPKRQQQKKIFEGNKLAAGATQSTQPSRKLKMFSTSTYKLHSLGDYASMVREYGATDSYSTQLVSINFVLVLGRAWTSTCQETMDAPIKNLLSSSWTSWNQVAVCLLSISVKMTHLSPPCWATLQHWTPSVHWPGDAPPNVRQPETSSRHFFIGKVIS